MIAFPGRTRLALVLLVATTIRPGLEAADLPRPGDDATYRPTVMIRREKNLGTGTVIASAAGETLILTASHVIAGTGPIYVELFRYNFGVEHVQAVQGYPRLVEATPLAENAEADLAILQVRGQSKFPYVAKLAKGDVPPAIGAKVTTIGFDRGAKLIGFATKVRANNLSALKPKAKFLPFIVTHDPPEHGRSGGGLFLADGSLVGVCVGRAEYPEGGTIGLFSSLPNIRNLIRDNEDVAASMARIQRKARAAAR